MTNDEILAVLSEIALDVLDPEDLEGFYLSIEALIEDIPKWDSLAHIGMITQMEAAFSIRFSLEEMEELNSIRSIVETIKAKT